MCILYYFEIKHKTCKNIKFLKFVCRLLLRMLYVHSVGAKFYVFLTVYLDIIVYWNPTRTIDSSKKNNTVSINCCTHTVLPPDDESKYARNM